MDYADCVQVLGQSDTWQAAYRQLDEAGELAIPAILDGLASTDWRVRRWCVALLDHHATNECLEPLVRALNDPVADVRRLAVHSVGCQGCKTAPLDVDVAGLLNKSALSDPHIQVRRVAAHMLGNQPYDQRIVATLTQILAQDRDPKLLSNAKWALSQQGIRKEPQ